MKITSRWPISIIAGIILVIYANVIDIPWWQAFVAYCMGVTTTTIIDVIEDLNDEN